MEPVQDPHMNRRVQADSRLRRPCSLKKATESADSEKRNAKRCVNRQDFLRSQSSEKLVGVVLQKGRRLIRPLAEARSHERETRPATAKKQFCIPEKKTSFYTYLVQ